MIMSWQEKVATYKLDVSIIPTSELEGLVRLEPEFYSRDFLFRKKTLDRHDTVYLDDIATIVSGAAYSSEEIDSNKNHENDIRIIKIGDVTNKRPFDDLDFISLAEVDKFASDLVSENDILMTMTGDPPDVGKVHIWCDKPEGEHLAFNQRICKIRPKKKSGFTPFGLYAYLMTEYARFQCERFAMGIRQRNVSIKDIKRLPVPRFSDAFLQKVNAVISCAFSSLNSSKIAMRAAETLLLQELGVADNEQAKKNIAIRSVVEATQANRFDAEYWQPKYADIEARIKTNKHATFGDIFEWKKGVEVGSEAYQEQGIPFIRIRNLSPQELTSNDQKCISPELYAELRDDYAPRKDEILFSKDGTVGIAYHLTGNMEGIISGGILRLNIKNKSIDPDYLTVCLNSLAVQMQVERYGGGSIIQHLKTDDAEKIFIPLLSPTQQKAIADGAHVARQKLNEAKTLIDLAKRAVEVFIEKDENAALKVIEAAL